MSAVREIDQDTRAALAKLIRLLSSPVDGEALGAVYAIRRLLRATKRDIHDLAALVERATPIPPPIDDAELPPWQAIVEVCGNNYRKLSPKERDFIRSLSRWRGEPTERQLVWLQALFERLAA